MKAIFTLIVLVIVLGFESSGQEKLINNNKPEREEWLRDVGFGMFVHWGVDTQLGTVISHSMVGASKEYRDRYINELPTTFNPKDWDPEKIAIMAKNAGMKYIFLTTKHHSGFALWDTKTTDFNSVNTPYGKDIVRGLTDAARKYGLAIGFYLSIEDFAFCHRNGLEDIRRVGHWDSAKDIQDKYKTYVEAQVKELMTEYGQVDLFFLDSQMLLEEVKAQIWKYQPNCLITRGAIPTPEQFVPGEAINSAWESNMTMGTQWNYKPTNEIYKSGNQLINLLIEARAKGGTYLLNIGPDQWGNLNEAQTGRLMEISAWNFINRESVQNVRPWIITNEGDIWFTRHKSESTVFAYLRNIPNWSRGDRKDFILRSVKATKNTEISVLGQSGNLVEYFPETDGQAKFNQTKDGLSISVVRAQRIYNNHLWPNPIVVKLTNVEPALEATKFSTQKVEVIENGSLKFNVNIADLGNEADFKLAFQYRQSQSTLEKNANHPWVTSNLIPVTQSGDFFIEVADPLFRGFRSTAENESDVVNASLSLGGIDYRAIIHQGNLILDGNVLSHKK